MISEQSNERYWLSGQSFMRLWPIARLNTALPLIAILALQALASLSLQNTAFQDEALYVYAGHAYINQLTTGQIVHNPYGQYLSGMPYFYPVIAGALDILGGLQAARLFSLVCMLFVTLTVYVTTKHLFHRDAALFATALFSVQGAVIFLGNFATYDALCLALLGLALALAVLADSKHHLLYWMTIGLVLFAAVAAKYAALLFVPPILAVLGWRALRNRGLLRALFDVLPVLVTFVVGIVLVLALNADIRQGIAFTTTNRSVVQTTAQAILFQKAVEWLGPLALLALIGLLLNLRDKPLLALIFFGAVLLAPMYHIYKTELTSMHKHMAFGALFGAPLAGYALAALAGFTPHRKLKPQWVVVAAVLLFFWNSGFGLAQSYYRDWTDSTQLVNVLRTQVRPDERILAEEVEVPRYYLQAITSDWQWFSLYWFEYSDKTNHKYQGIDAYKVAIADGYWDLIVFRYGPNADVERAIDQGVKTGKNYELIAKVPVTNVYGDSFYWVWRKVPTP